MVDTGGVELEFGLHTEPPEFPAHCIETIAGTEHVEGSSGFCLGVGDITMAKSFHTFMDQGLLVMRELCAARRVSPWIRLASQFGMSACHAWGRGVARS